MEINVATAIEELLDRRETVTLIGIGSITLESLSAKISEDEKTIAPPQVKLGFYEVQTDNEPLRKYLMYQYNLTKKDANKALKKYSQSVLNALANYGEVKLDGIANITTEDGKYKLKALESFKAKYYEGLPILPISKLGDTSKAEPIDEAPIPKPTPQKQSTLSTSTPAVKTEDLKLAKPATPPAPAKPAEVKVPDIKPAVASASTNLSTTAEKVVKATGVAAAGSGIGKVASSIKETTSGEKQAAKPMNLNEKLALKNKSTAASTSSSAIKSTNPKTITTTTSTEKPKKRYALPPQSTHTPVPPKKESLGCIGPFFGLLGLLLFAFLVWKGVGCIMNNGKAKVPATEMLTAAADNLADKAGETMDDATAKMGEAKDAIVDAAEGAAGKVSETVSEVKEDLSEYPQGISESCVIIIGSFSNYQNVNAAERKLKNRGYSVYVEEYGPYTRVGFEFDCTGKNLEAYIQDIRRSIESKAWYLQPELHVDY